MDDSYAQLSIATLKMQWSLRFSFSHVQNITQRYKQTTVLELSLQSIQSSWKIRMILISKCSVGKPRIALLQIYTLDCQQK